MGARRARPCASGVDVSTTLDDLAHAAARPRDRRRRSIVWLLFNADRIGWLKALGYSLLAVVVLGPVVQPWYLTWGLLLLAVVADGPAARLGDRAVGGLAVRRAARGPQAAVGDRPRPDDRDRRRALLAVVAAASPRSAPGPPTTAHRRRAARDPRVPAPGSAQSRHCSSTTSSHRPCLRPTARSTPTSSKPHDGVQADRRLVAVHDPSRTRRGTRCPSPRSSRSASSRPPTPRPARRAVDVDGVLDGGRVGGTVAERAQAREAERRAARGRRPVVVDGDERRMRTSVPLDPCALLLEGPRHEVEGHRWFRHLGVVDRRDGSGVVRLDESRPHCRSVVEAVPDATMLDVGVRSSSLAETCEA